MKLSLNKITKLSVISALAYAAAGCGAGAVACQIIHVADDVCTVVAVPLPDGGTEQVPVTAEDLRAVAATAKARRAAAAAAAYDAGAPAQVKMKVVEDPTDAGPPPPPAPVPVDAGPDADMVKTNAAHHTPHH